MTRLRNAALSAAAILTLAAGCDGGTAPPTGQAPTGSHPAGTASPTPAPTASRTPTPTAPPTDPAVVIAADGIGGYQIGSSLTDLAARGLVTHLSQSASCTDSETADTTGAYAGKVTLTFRGGKLLAIHTTNNGYVTPSGAKVGMTLTALQGIYGTRGTVITGQAGNKAYSVRVPATALALVFSLDQSNTTVASMSAGEAQSLEDATRTGTSC